jgi:hypothetical protein
MKAPLIKVGIMAEKEISFLLEENYLIEGSTMAISGKCIVKKDQSGICLKSDGENWIYQKNLNLIPIDSSNAKFTLHNVTIGINFHWERKEDQVSGLWRRQRKKMDCHRHRCALAEVELMPLEEENGIYLCFPCPNPEE